MKKNRDQFEEIIKSEYDRIARQEEEELLRENDIDVPEGLIDDIYLRIEEEKKTADRKEANERETAYAGLSEEDRKALELGRKALEDERTERTAVKVVRKRKRRKVYIALVAAVVLALGAGVASMGGPERVVSLVKQAVGGREVAKINSDKNNLVITEEKEEEAYQTIKEELGVYPVRVVYESDQMEFEKMEFDQSLQMAELYYSLEGETIVYFVNASYDSTSCGISVEDEIVKTEEKTIKGCNIEMKEYRTSETNTERHSASFSYKGLEYFLVGTMDEEDFNYLVDNLFFY